MTDKELIKQEIERLKNKQLYIFSKGENEEIYGTALTCIGVYNQLLSFINSLPEEPANEDLEEYYKKEFLPKEWFAKPGQRTISQFNFFTAQHFAEWQKQQMKETLQTEYEKGRFDMREELIKNTVLETKVMMDCDGDGIETPYEEWLTLENTEIQSLPDNLGLKEGDRVKIIIVKEEQ